LILGVVVGGGAAVAGGGVQRTGGTQGGILGVTLGNELAAYVGMPAGVLLVAGTAGGSAGAAALVVAGGVVGAAFVGAAAAAVGGGFGRNTVNDTPVAVSAATARSATTATTPLRDFGCGSTGRDESSAADPSVAYDCALGGVSETRAVSLAASNGEPLGMGASGIVRASRPGTESADWSGIGMGRGAL
jgi:hypothetical protein